MDVVPPRPHSTVFKPHLRGYGAGSESVFWYKFSEKATELYESVDPWRAPFLKVMADSIQHHVRNGGAQAWSRIGTI